ncbi:uncharacterized protein Z518_09844 [Rhinocladiella mackenziei CBS 650.93]|uniref:Uncharacterized protein n=1 Tax=Rhinocladiella mackenziei CBS 650.93 TaxID=1442369 RepID=A0A0D2I4N9_9EURO|nr:uncharacterized protein Z518_09844 [Rhinocladiella mackenziei CBS 650.93]KIX00779.1 hypothetical protein Z518_09844 [Rhinocladiella mackenziei CBS 650.93]
MSTSVNTVTSSGAQSSTSVCSFSSTTLSGVEYRSYHYRECHSAYYTQSTTSMGSGMTTTQFTTTTGSSSITTTSTSSAGTTTTTTTQYTQLPPHYSPLVSTGYASARSAFLNIRTLCLGSNDVAANQASYPITLGAYNYQKVALSNNQNVVEEVECYMDTRTGPTPSASYRNIYSLECYMDICT